MACSFDQQVKNGIVNAVAQEATDTGMFTRDNDTLIVINKDGNFRGPISLINDKYGEEIIKEIDNTFLIEPSQNLVDQYIQARNEDYLLRVEEIADSIGGVYGTLLKSDPYPTLKEIAEQSYGYSGDVVVGENMEETAKKAFGEELVSIAQSMYPKEEVQIDPDSVFKTWLDNLKVEVTPGTPEINENTFESNGRVYYNNDGKYYISNINGKSVRRITATEYNYELSKNSNDSLFGLDQGNLEFDVNTLNVVSQFLEKVGIEQRLVPEFLSADGSVVAGAVAAANFMQGTVDIIDDVEKRPTAWNKLPEEAAHWWYRLLRESSALQEELFAQALYSDKFKEIKDKKYAGLTKDSDITEEAIGQLIADAIKRIEERNAAPNDYSFLKAFLDWVNSILDLFRSTEQDPFEIAAMKILSSDMSDLMTWAEYSKLNNIVNFADVLTEQSVAPIDYTIIEDIGEVFHPFLDEDNFYFNYKDGRKSPEFRTLQELDNWVSANIPEHDKRQRTILQEVRDNQQFFDRLLNKSFRKKSKYLPKTLKKYYRIIDSSNATYSFDQWNISQQLKQITKKLSEQEKKQIIDTNGYTNIGPTLKVLPNLLQKYRKNPIVLSEPIKIDGAKKQELSILNGIREMIKLENPNLKSIKVEDFVAEAHNWLETNYLLGFANEQSHLSYRIDQIFTNVKDRFSNEDFQFGNITEEEIQQLPLEERQRIANVLGLTKQNPDVYHNKVSIRFNDKYHLNRGHFNLSPSAWGNLTYFYTGKNKWKDAVLLHEIQNDNIEALREYKSEKVELESSLNQYLQGLNAQLMSNIYDIENASKRISKRESWEVPRTEKYIQLNYQLAQLENLPLDQGLNQLKENLNERIELYKSDNGILSSPEKANEALTKSYSNKRKFAELLRRGGLKSLLTKDELEELKNLLAEVNTQITEEIDFQGATDQRPLTINEKKREFINKSHDIVAKMNFKFRELYGEDAPSFILRPPTKPRRRGAIIGSEDLNESVNYLMIYAEQKINKVLSTDISINKKTYIQALSLANGNKFNISLSKITQEQYNNLIENYKYNNDLLNRLVDEQAKKDLEKSKQETTVDEDNRLLSAEFYEIVDTRPESANSVSTADKPLGTFEFGYGSLFEHEDYFYLSLRNGFAKIKKDDVEESLKKSARKESRIINENKVSERLKKQALAKKAELEKNYDQIQEEIKQTLEIEINYFTPLVHHLIQKHINQYGKDFPMYFAGYNITKLTQGSDRTAMIYAGKNELIDHNEFTLGEDSYGIIQNKYWKNREEITKEQYEESYELASDPKNLEEIAKNVKYQAAIQIGLADKIDTPSKDQFTVNGYTYRQMDTVKGRGKYRVRPEGGDYRSEDVINITKYNQAYEALLGNKKTIIDEAIKKLNDYKKQSKENLDKVVNTIMNITGNKPIETGAIYNAMSQISGVKLIWQDSIPGLRGKPVNKVNRTITGNSGTFLVKRGGFEQAGTYDTMEEAEAFIADHSANFGYTRDEYEIVNVKEEIPGGTGGYLVDLSNYNYNVPILYGINNPVQDKQVYLDELKKLKRVEGKKSVRLVSPTTNESVSYEVQSRLKSPGSSERVYMLEELQKNKSGKVTLADSKFKNAGIYAYLDFYINNQDKDLIVDTMLSGLGIKVLDKLTQIGLVRKTNARIIHKMKANAETDYVYTFDKSPYIYNSNFLTTDRLIGNLKSPSYNEQKEYYLSKDVNSLLKNIIKLTEDNDTKLLAQSLLEVPNIGDIPLAVTKYTKELRGRIEDNSYALGTYNSAFPELITVVGNLPKRTFETVFLHELVHGITVNEYYKNEEFSDKIFKLYNYALKFKDYMTSKGKTLGEMYGMKNPREFMAEAMTNPDFIFELSKYYSPTQEKLKGKNIFQEFIDLVVNIIKERIADKGKKYIKNNLGTAVLNTISNYAKVNTSNLKSLSKLENEQPAIKPGVPELFDSNPELANSVYEALGIYNVWHSSDSKIEKFISENVNGYFAKAKGGSPKAVFFTANKPPQESFLSKREYQEQFAVKMNNPLIVDYSKDPNGNPEGKNREQWVKEALEKGHDGLIWKNISDNGFVGDVYISLNAENITKVTPQQKQQAQQLYSQYLDSIFPDSQYKDITYRAGVSIYDGAEATKTYGGIWFAPSVEDVIQFKKMVRAVKEPVVTAAVLNIKQPKEYVQFWSDYMDDVEQYSLFDGISPLDKDKLADELKKEGHDGIIIGDDAWMQYEDITIHTPQQVVFQPNQIHILGSKQDIEGFKKFNKNGVFLSSSSYASQVLNEDQLSIFKRLQLGRLVSKVAAPFTVRGTNQKLYSIPKIKEDYDGNIIYKKDYSKKRNLDNLIKEQGWDWIRTRETQDAIMVELGDFTGDQLKIFDSLPSETQSSPASSITQKKVLQFLSNIGFTDIQSVKTLMHNGEELEGNAYVDMINAVMQIVEGQEDVSLPEEAMHILVELVQKADPALFRAMEKQVVDYDLYRRLLRDPAYTTNKYYKTASGAIDYNKLKKEAIAKLLAEYLIGNTEGTIESQNKVLIVNTWWRQLVNWIKRTFGPYKNPFKEALSRLETDNQAFGVFSDLSPEDQLFLSATKKNMTTRDEEYKATKTAYENIKNKAADSGVTKINNAYYKDGKRWAYSESELKDMTDDQLAAAAREFAVTPGERYKTIGEIRKNQGKRVSDLKDAFYKSLFKNKPLDQDLMPIFERMAEDGNFIHTLLEDAVNALIDGKTGLLRDKPGTPNTSLSSDRVQVGMQNQINKFIKGFVSAFPEGTRFLSETIVYDEFTKELGTVDFMAIIPILDENGKVTGEKIDIYDWKSILFNTVESVKDYKKEGFNIQLNEYKRILRDSYGISQFGKIRAIPVKRIYGKEVNGVKPLAGIQIGDVDPSKINDIQLRPIISNEESTGDKQKDDVITKLNGIYQTFVNKLKQGKLQGREILSEIDNAIYELRVSDSVTQLRIYLKDLEGKVSQLLSNIEANKSVDKDVLDDYLLDISLYETIFESISAVRLLDETGLSLDEKQKLANVIYVLEKKVIILKEKRKELVAKQAEKDNIFGLLSPEKVVKGLTKIFRSLGNQPVATMRYLYKLASRSYTRIDMETDEELKKLQELRLRFSEYAKRKGLSNKDAIKKLVNFEKGSLHSKVDKSFFEQREVVVESKNAEKIKDFIRNNYNYQEYAIWYQAELKKNTDFWESLKGSYDVDPKEDEKIRKIKRLNFEKNYNIERFPLTAFSPYNKQLWNKNIIEEKWLSKEYEEIQKDNDLKEMYEFFMRKNKELLAVGAIEEWQSYSFLPNVRKTYADIFSFQDVNWFEKIKDTTFNGLKKWKKSLTVEDYESNYLPERDPITGEITDRRFVRFVTKLDNNTEIYAKVADKLGIKRKGTETLLQSIERWKLESPGNPKKFEDEVISLREMSFDIFAIYGLMSKEIAKEKYLQENDEVIRALVHIEKTKKNYETNKWGNITMNGNVPVMPDNLIGQNAPLLEQYAKAVTEGQSIQVDTDNAITFGIRKRWNESFAGKIYKFNINPDTYKPTSISTTKFLMWLNNVHQKRVLGLNLSSAASNLFGGTFSSDKLYSKYVSREDLAKAWTQLTSVAWYQSDDMRKRAALVDYFLPLLNNREAHKSSQLSVNQSVKILSQEWLMSPMRTTDELVQLHIFLAHLENTGLKEGKLVNLRELAAKETNYFDRYKLPVDQRSKVEENFEKHLEKLKKDFSLSKQSIYKTVKINGKDETVIDIPGIERTSDEVHKMRNLSQTMAKDALGAMDEYDYAPYRMNIYWRLFMTFKNWIPRGGDVRFGEFHYSESHNSHEYGRFRMLWRSFATNYVASVTKMIPVVGNLTKKWGREDIIQKAIKVYEEKKRIAQQLGQYDENFITQGEFVDMFVKGTEATFAEFRTITLMMSLLAFGIMKGDDDDSAEEKSFKALMRRQIDKMQDEVSFFYSPKSGIDIAGTTAPLIGLVRDSYSLFNNFSKEMFGIAFETIGFEETGVEMQEKAKPMKYTFKTLPVLKEILTYMPLIDNEIAKDWGVRVQNRNGF